MLRRQLRDRGAQLRGVLATEELARCGRLLDEDIVGELGRFFAPVIAQSITLTTLDGVKL